MKIYGSIKFSQRNIKTGEIKKLVRKKNLIVNQSGDAMAVMAGANSDYAIRFMYFEFRNGAVTPEEPDISDSILHYTALESPDDYLRVPILAAPVIDVSDEDEETFAGNRSTWFATTQAAPTDGSGNILGETNEEELTDGTSRIYSIGLIASSGLKSSDLLFARVLLENGPAIKAENYHYDMHWAIKFAP